MKWITENPMSLVMAAMTIIIGYYLISGTVDDQRMHHNGNIPVEEIKCKSVEDTGGLFGSAEYYIFNLDNHRYKVFQKDWDRYNVPYCGDCTNGN